MARSSAIGVGQGARDKDQGARIKGARDIEKNEMNDLSNFKSLKVWQLSHSFVLEIYTVTKNFPKEELFSLTNQLRRAVISIPANISEGKNRHSKKELLQFLYIARGSLGEVEYYLLLAKDLQFISSETYFLLETKRKEIGKLLFGLIRSIE